MRRRTRATLATLATLGLAATLAACGSMAPRHERPAAPVASRFPDLPAGSGVAAAALPDWQRFFSDERLKRLVSLALANNRDLRVAALAIEASRAQLQARNADLWPTLSAGALVSRQPNGRGAINSLYSAGIQVTAYEADLFGRLRSAGDAAAAQLQGSIEARDALQVSLVGAVANAYLALLADDEVLRVTREALTTRETSLRLVRLRFDAGASSEIDLRQAQSLLESARAGAAQAQRQRALDANALALLLGQPQPADLPPARPLAEAAGMPELPVGLPSEVLVRRPDVRQAEQQLIAANANIGAARAAFFPRISLTGSLGSASTELDGLFRSGNWAWSFGAQLLQPLFDAGRNEANLKLATASRDIALAQYERAVQTAFREVADALAGRATLDEQQRAQQRQVEAEAARVRLAELRYRNGTTSHLEYLDAQRSLLAAQLALVQLQAQSAQNLAALYRVLGGGWNAQVEPRAN